MNTSDIIVGNVAYLDPDRLNQDPRVVAPSSPTPKKDRLRPFLCVEADGEYSAWTPITTTSRSERLLIPTRTRRGGDYGWLEDGQFLNDGATVYAGENAAFVAASAEERPFRHSRPSVNAEGVDSIKREIARRGGATLKQIGARQAVPKQ